jgi:hypothetical protein
VKKNIITGNFRRGTRPALLCWCQPGGTVNSLLLLLLGALAVFQSHPWIGGQKTNGCGNWALSLGFKICGFQLLKANGRGAKRGTFVGGRREAGGLWKWKHFDELEWKVLLCSYKLHPKNTHKNYKKNCNISSSIPFPQNNHWGFIRYWMFG